MQWYSKLLKEKWTSILFHITNRISWTHGYKHFHKCCHADLSEREQSCKKWLHVNSAAFTALERIVNDKKLLKDLDYVAEFRHTGNLEVYHSLLNKYCPKRLAFSYDGMYARTQLAVLDHNCGINREQAKRGDGKLRYKVVFSKVTGSWVSKKILVDKKRTYIKEIINEIRKIPENYKLKNREAVPKNIATYPNPGKEIVIKSKTSRFVK